MKPAVGSYVKENLPLPANPLREKGGAQVPSPFILCPSAGEIQAVSLTNGVRNMFPRSIEAEAKVDAGGRPRGKLVYPTGTGILSSTCIPPPLMTDPD